MQAGFMILLAFFVGAMGLPALVIFPLYLGRYPPCSVSVQIILFQLCMNQI